MEDGGDSYIGYISNDYTNDNGDYTTNPIITVTLSATVPNMEYISVKFVGGIDTSYPKIFKIRTYKSNTLIREHTYNMTTQTGLPLFVAKVNDTNVSKVEFEFVGTMCPHRRTRLNSILFGKAEQIDPYYLQSWKVDDKASLVADSIPTKILEYSIIDYEGNYDIDNPGNKIPTNYKDVNVFFTFGMEKDGLWKYSPTKIFNLMDISTTPDGIVTFSCGSILDILTDTYDHDIYTGTKQIRDVIPELLSFSGINADQCELNEFGTYKIDMPIPESPVREIIQRLAFSCGATLTVNNENKIIFSKKLITAGVNTPKFKFHRPEPFTSAGVFLEEPNAEPLPNTTNLAMYTYTSNTDQDVSEIATVDISTTTPTRISFPSVKGAIEIDRQSIEDQGATLVSVYDIYSTHAIVTLNWPNSITGPISVKVYGKKINTTKTVSKFADMNTLLLDSGMTRNLPENLDPRMSNVFDPITFYYTDWYGAKFKYKCKTRNEYLVRAGDIILFETPYSNGEATRVGYVLRNSYSNGDSGEMEVITIGNN